ncbi:MAG: DUF4274 domain-containing protein [Sphingomonadales bacterium]|nr:MAG: DUF4274 domain-containing protein [Sphingomonadales bacterium]
MLYPPDFDEKIINDEQNALLDLMRWLSERPPAVRHVLVPGCNVDTCMPLFQWAAEDPDTDFATVAAIFWQAEPAFFAQEFANGEHLDEENESYALILDIIARVERGFYSRFRFGLEAETLQTIAQQRAALAKLDKLPFAIPAVLAGPFAEGLPPVHAADTPSQNAKLWDMLFALGMWRGSRPGSADAISLANTGETAEQRRARLTAGTVLLGFSAVMGSLLYWLT